MKQRGFSTVGVLAGSAAAGVLLAGSQIGQVQQKQQQIANKAAILNPQRQLLGQHAAALRAAGVPAIEGLGTLSISGSVLAQRGVATPADQVGNVMSPFGRARRYDPGAGGWGALSGQGRVIKTRPSSGLKSTLVQDTAYWVAQAIDIPSNTSIVLQYPNKHLVMIAQSIKFGQNVTLTYERAPVNAKPKPATPGAPGTPAQSGGTGVAGSNGANGTEGAAGDSYAADPAPEFQIWTLDVVQGVPAVDARGQDGGPGGPAGDGGPGGAGGKGKDAVRLTNNGFDGGPGGKGGRGGNGGPGGSGGKGGKVAFYSLQSEITQLTGSGYAWEISGGAGGVGGPAGVPGPGGDGGEGGGGIKTLGAWTKTPGNKGATGPQGDAGGTGATGQPGAAQPGAVQFVPITQSDFSAELLNPHIQTIVTPVPTIPPDQVRKGDQITVNGLNFATDDTVMIVDGANLKPCATQFIADSTLKFTVPVAEGGASYIQVKRSNGTLSNKKSLIVLPTLDASLAGARMKPGDAFTLTGSGFKANSRIFVSWGNGQPVEVTNNKNGANAVTYTNSGALKWNVTRPAGKVATQAEAFGETVSLTVKLPDGTTSNAVSMNYDNYVLLVVGDSMAWGTGLEVSEKHFTKVGQRVQQTILDPNLGRMQLITVVVAHTGAIIGWSKPSLEPAIYGEVPTDYPTIKAQISDVNTPAKAPYVDLIVLFGGVNDIGFTKVLDPSKDVAFVQTQCDQYLFNDMKAFLQDAVLKFQSAKIAVCGYQLIFSNSTDFSSAIAKALYTNILGFVPTQANTAKSVQHSYLFRDYGKMKLTQSVNAANAGLPSQRVFFADPNFQDDHALYAPNTLLFTPTQMGSLGSALVVDPAESATIRAQRKAAVDANPTRCEKNFGYCASAGHPNQAGATRYANAIISALGL